MNPLELALQAMLFAPLVDQRATPIDAIGYYRFTGDERSVQLISWLVEAYPRRGLGYMRLNDIANRLPQLFPNVH